MTVDKLIAEAARNRTGPASDDALSPGDAVMADILDTPPAGWFPLDVMKASDGRKWDWVAFMVDVHPDELKHCHCKTAFLYVHPDDYKPDGNRTAQEAWVRVPGKHRNKDAAWDALHDIISTPGH